MPVAYEELAGFPKFKGSGVSMEAVSQGRIAWTDGNAFFQELFPPPIGGVPQLPKLFPGSAVLYAADVSFEPFLGEDDVPRSSLPNTYDVATATVTYREIPYQVSDGGVIYTVRTAIGGEFLTLRNTGLQWLEVPDSGPTVPERINDPEMRAGMLICTREHHITLHFVPASIYATLYTNIGLQSSTVNDESFQGIPPECLMFLGAETTQTVTRDGSISYQVDLTFKERQIKSGDDIFGWNHFFREDRPGGAKWVEISTTDGKPLYKLTDFTQLLS